MQNPKLIPVPFANSGLKDDIPKVKSTSMSDEKASWEAGFPESTMLPVYAGGLPPDGKDFNGVLNQISENIVFQSKGGRYKFDPDFALSIGGYPKGATLQSNDESAEYQSLIDSNLVNFNTASPEEISQAWRITGIGDASEVLNRKFDKASVKNNLGLSQVEVVSQKVVTELGAGIVGNFMDGLYFVPYLTSRDQIVVLYSDAGIQAYCWTGNFPKYIPEGSTPQSTGGIGEGAWLGIGGSGLLEALSKNTGLSLIGEESGRNAQEVVNELKTRSVLGYSNPPQINISSVIASTPSVESSELVLGANNTLNEIVELIVRVNKVDDIDVYIYGDLASQINTTQAATHVVYGGCDDLERNGYGGMSSGITIVSQSDDKVHIKLAISSLTKDYLAFSYRNQPNSTLTQKVFKMVIKQSGAVIARTHFDFIGGSDKWAPPGVSTKNINFNNEFVQRLQIDRNVSRLKSSGILKISPDGADRYKGDTFSLKFAYNVIRPSFMNFIREVQVMAGEYKEGGISQAFFINSPTRIISIGGYADIYLGQYPSTSDWVQIQSSPRYTFSAPYDWESSPDPAIRAGTKQPYVGVEVPRWKTKSMRDYALKQVGSKALVLATDFSYWYDWENKTVYWSFGEVNDTAYIFISEADYGLNVASSVICTMSGVRFYGSKDNPVRGYAGSYLSFNRGGGLLSLHNCEVHGSYTGNGFATSNIDSELINCKSFSVNNDGFNAHNGGIMNIVGGGAYHSGDDGASPHENCIMYMQDTDFHYSFAGNVTVAFGAIGFGYRLSSIAADNLSTKPYSGALSVISGQGSGATARFLDCYTDTRGIAPSEYYAQSQEAGKVATIDISRRRRASGSVESVIGGTDTIVSLS